MQNATLELTQNVCHRYGWSLVFDTNESGYWYAEVGLGLDDKRQFVSADASPPTKRGVKQGKDAAAQLALAALRPLIQEQEAKPVLELSQVFAQQELPILASNPENWQIFWQDQPTSVGIDTEGNQIKPPVLVQIASDNYVILEVPKKGQLSKDLVRLLTDNTIVKVFCDNVSHHDKKALGVPNRKGLTSGPIVDLEVLVNHRIGPASAARGLSRIVSLTMPELKDVRIAKPPRSAKARFKNIGRYAMIEQGKAPPLKSIAQLSENEQRYAALDAWCTLQAFRRLEGAAVMPA